MIDSIEQVPLITTSRLILRQIEPSDANDIYEYCKSPVVGPDAGWKPHENLEESLKIIELFKTMFAVWGIAEKNDNKIIGSIGLHKSTRTGYCYDLELGYALSNRHWGKGYMTEAAKAIVEYAFNVIGANTLYVSHFDFNNRSKRVIEKVGFKHAGELKQSWHNYDGRSLDEVCYLLDRNAYSKQSGEKCNIHIE